MDINTEGILTEIDKVGVYLSEKLQVPVEKAYEVLMRQVYFEFSWAIVWLIVGTILAIVGIFTVKYVRNYILNCYSQRRLDTDDWTILIGIGCCFSIGSLTLFFVNLYTILQILINPEWYMIQMILEKLQ